MELRVSHRKEMGPEKKPGTGMPSDSWDRGIPKPSQDRGTPGTEQQSKYLLYFGRYASFVQVGLSCCDVVMLPLSLKCIYIVDI